MSVTLSLVTLALLSCPITSGGQRTVQPARYSAGVDGSTVDGTGAVAPRPRSEVDAIIDCLFADPESLARLFERIGEQLASVDDASALLGVTSQRVHQLAASHPDFPDPVLPRGGVRYWRPGLRAFLRVWARDPGRRARS